VSSAIELKDVVVKYGDSTAVHATSLDVAPGELHVLLGHSGSGKTTLLRAIAGFERAAGGRIALAGTTVDDGASTWVAPERRRVGLVFQDYALFPHLDVASNVGFGVGARQVESWLTRVGLEGYANRAPGSLSGGEQQRVALARALACDPSVVLLDEPFSNLDRGLRQSLREVTVDVLRAAGATAIFVTHDAAEALGLADRVTVLDHGHRLQTGTPREVYETPTSRQAALCVGEASFLPGEGGTCALGAYEPREGSAGGATVMLRPEDVVLDDNGVVASVLRSTYVGAETLVTLSLDGHEIRGAFPHSVEGEVRVGLRGPVATLD
jgi:iron(III) transport system ATP-binding protein